MDGMAILTNKTGVNYDLTDGISHSFQIFDTGNNLNAPFGTNWETTFFIPSDPDVYAQWQLSNMGDLFGIAIDSEKNVYFTTTATAGGNFNVGSAGPGGVYKMNADDWSISNFITTGTGNNQMPNQTNLEAGDQGVGLGNICYDKWHNQLLITNFEDGKIYRYDTQGNFLSTFDPFNPDDGSQGLPGFNETIFGINVFGTNTNDIKVYFSRWRDDAPVASVWSVNLDATGEFIGVESLCFDIPFQDLGTNLPKPISDITFSSDGKMYVAENTLNKVNFFGVNLFDNELPDQSMVFEFTFDGNIWTKTQDYYVGNYDINRNASGGIALGNRQTKNGLECEALIWATGDKLKYPGSNINSFDNEFIYGVAAIPISGNNQGNVASTSIYVDTDIFNNAAKSQSKVSQSDIEIYRDPNSQSTLTISPNTTICNGESIQLNISGGSNYEWSPALTLDDSNSANPIATPTENTTYTVTGEGGECGGGGTASVTINIDDFNFSLGPDIVNCVTAEGQTLDAGEEAQSYLWNTGETTQTINATTTGDYTVNVVSPAGCDYSDEISLINSQAPTLAFSTPNNSSCPPASFTLNDESIPIESDPIIAWNWQVNGNNYNNSTTSIGLQNSGSYAVTLEVTTELGCVETLTIDDYLNVFSAPTPEFITEPAELSKCDKTIELINLSSDYDSLSWDFGDGITINEDTVNSYTYSEVSDYTIALTTINDIGCESTFYKQITPTTSIPFFAPNAFTPDSDALNEVFIPLLGCHENFEFWVFNRWGENIFYSNDINKGWDGTYKNQLSPIGIYSWKARYDGTKDNQVKFGEVHLMH
ncbi:MAG: PKD domain-containing protein [Flavobacteriales bacterium]